MTMVYGIPSGLQQLQLGFNEVASALVIGKIVGSVFTRSNDAEIFNVLEKHYDVRIIEIPKWLHGFQFSRTGVIHGQGLRRVPCSSLMNDIDIFSLQGFASTIVLCCRYVESVKNIETILENLIASSHKAVFPGKLGDWGTRLSIPMKALLSNFVRATIDCDANSQQSARVINWMAELGSEVGVSTKLKFSRRKGRDYNLDLLIRLMGDLDGLSGYKNKPEDDGPQKKPSQYIHNTLSMGAASIALAAAANGADVSLQCFTPNDIKTIPSGSQNAGFVVRLWLRQPPPKICNYLFYNEAETKSALEEDDTYAAIVFGGELEAALNVAKEIGYGINEFPSTKHSQRIQNLWEKGRQKGKLLQWMVTKPSQWLVKPSVLSSGSNPPFELRFELKERTDCVTIPPQVDCLVNMLNDHDKRLSPIARTIALVLHEVYLYTEYPTGQSAEFSNAMIFISIAITVGSLQAWTFAPANDKDQYALELSSVRPGGGLRELLPLSMGGQGVRHDSLLWAGATLWGGASLESQGNMVTDERVIGIVAPHCSIVLELLRNPLGFARSPMSGNMLTMCRGSMPMLLRNPKSGFITSSNHGLTKRHVIDCGQNLEGQSSLIDTLRNEQPENELIITLEPEIETRSSHSLFCGWFAGDLSFELDPLTVFRNLLLRQYSKSESEPRSSDSALSDSDIHQNPKLNLKSIDVLNLLEFELFQTQKGVTVFNAFSDPAWLLAVAGCAMDGTLVLLRDTVDIEGIYLDSGDSIVYFEK